VEAVVFLIDHVGAFFCALNALRRSTLERARPLDWHGLTAQIDWICPSLPFYISGDLNCMRYSTSFK
jgi:hypothetical protein